MGTGHADSQAVPATKITFTAIACLLTLARLYTRTRIVRNAGWDDFFVGVSMIASIILSLTTHMQVHYGMGSQPGALDPADDSKVSFWFWIAVIIYSIALGCVKVSILLQYLRILPRGVRAGHMDERSPRSKYRIATLAMIGVVSAVTIWAVVSAMFTCFPVQKYWNSDISGGCLPRRTIWYVNAGADIVTGIAIVAIPLPALCKLPIPRRQKQILLFVFGIAGLIVMMSILRIPFVYIYSTQDGPSWDSPIVSILNSLEINIGIIVSCIPTLRGLVCQLFPSICPDKRSVTYASGTTDRNAFDENDMEDLGGLAQPENRSSSRSSAGTATNLSDTNVPATARPDD